MKILFINPIMVNKHSPTFIITEPLGLAYIAAMLTDDEVAIIDGAVNGLKYSEIEDKIKKFKPDIVAISASFSVIIKESMLMASFIKTNFPDIKIVLGGPTATFLAEKLIKEDFVDFIIKGEGELAFKNLVEKLKNNEKDLNNIPGLYYKSKDEIRDTGPHQVIQDLDSLPLPARHLMPDKSCYERAVITARGCPYGCIYCSSNAFFQKYRRRSVKNIIEEIGILYGPEYNYKNDNLLFIDDILTFDHNYVKELCAQLDKLPEKRSWLCYGRIENITKDLLSTMKRSGCGKIFFGIESGSQRILDKLKRKYTPTDVLKTLNLCKELGIETDTGFIIGLPYETKEDIKLTFDLMEKTPETATVSMLTAFPGTEIFNNPQTYGLDILPHNQEEDNMDLYAWVSNGFLTREEIMEAHTKSIGINIRKCKKNYKK